MVADFVLNNKLLYKGGQIYIKYAYGFMAL